jgi:hypothetical protein
MVEVTVGDQDPVETAEAEAGSKDLPLGAFPAIDQKAVIAVRDDLR